MAYLTISNDISTTSNATSNAYLGHIKRHIQHIQPLIKRLFRRHQVVYPTHPMRHQVAFGPTSSDISKTSNASSSEFKADIKLIYQDIKRHIKWLLRRHHADISRYQTPHQTPFNPTFAVTSNDISNDIRHEPEQLQEKIGGDRILSPRNVMWRTKSTRPQGIKTEDKEY